MSQFVGTVGKRMQLFVKCVRVTAFSKSYYGHQATTYFNICVDRYGNSIVYKGSSRWTEGNYYGFEALVKEHKVYKEENQTIVNRPKITVVKDSAGTEIKLQ